jgi:hypothetical protein
VAGKVAKLGGVQDESDERIRTLLQEDAANIELA